MSIQAISNVVDQMKELSTTYMQVNNVNNSSPLNSASTGSGDSIDFAVYLKDALNSISSVQNESKAKSEAFELGETGIELSDIIIDSQKASISLQLAVQVRNRVVQAYSEIMSMPV